MNPIRGYSSLRILEAFHVRLLLQLSARGDGALYLKGGVALRLFYGSPRYSEDMDFDAEGFLRDRLKRTIPRLIEHASFLAPLRPLGLQGIKLYEDPAKDTGTTLRFKMGLLAGGDIPEPTKVEISFRGDVKNAEPPPLPASAATPVAAIVDDYVPHGTDWSHVRRYPHATALWQKVRALAYRRQVQARDVFDLHHLGQQVFGDYPTKLLRTHLDDETLREAEERTMDVDPEEFRETVLRYLPEELRQPYFARWDDMRMAVVDQLAAIRAASPAAAGPTKGTPGGGTGSVETAPVGV